MNDVRHVYNVVYSAAENMEELLQDLVEIRKDNDKLGEVLRGKETKNSHEEAHELSVGICHYGEALLYQRWLAEDQVSGGFLNAKEAIHHAIGEQRREATYYDFRKLHESVVEMLATSAGIRKCTGRGQLKMYRPERCDLVAMIRP